MEKTIFTILMIMFLFSFTVLARAEDISQNSKEKYPIETWHGTIYNTSIPDDHMENNERKIEPAPQPVLDLPNDRVFYITTFSISLIVIFCIYAVELINKYGFLKIVFLTIPRYFHKYIDYSLIQLSR